MDPRERGQQTVSTAVTPPLPTSPPPPPPPRTWELPPEPTNEITAVRDRYGQIFQRVEDPDRPRVTWHGTTFLDDPDVPDFVLEWPMLLSDLGPLTDATAEWDEVNLCVRATEETTP